MELAPQTVSVVQALSPQTQYGARPRPLAPRSTEEERALHAEFVRANLKDKAVWLKLGVS